MAIPVFVIGVLAIGLRAGAISWRLAALGAVGFMLVAIPIVVFLAVNLLRWDTITWGGLSMPRLPGVPRFQSEVATGSGLLENGAAQWKPKTGPVRVGCALDKVVEGLKRTNADVHGVVADVSLKGALEDAVAETIA